MVNSHKFNKKAENNKMHNKMRGILSGYTLKICPA